jgi:hypothetical protein
LAEYIFYYLVCGLFFYDAKKEDHLSGGANSMEYPLAFNEKERS